MEREEELQSIRNQDTEKQKIKQENINSPIFTS